MITVKQVLATAALGIAAAVCQAQVSADSHSLHSFSTPADSLMTGGQPSQSQLLQLKNAGITKVINLRGVGEEIPFNEKAAVEALGMEYVSLPIKGAADVTLQNARKLHELLQGQQKVFLHCASGNRVGALLAIRAHAIEGKPVETSLQIGRAAGLGSLAETVKSVIGEGRSKTAQ